MNRSAPEESAAAAANRIAVYTAVFGAYDSAPNVGAPDPALDYFFFTDDASQLVPAPWQARLLEPVFTDPQRDARRVKLLPHLFLPDHAASVWVDANCELLDLTAAGILDLLGDAEIALPAHQHRACVYEEAGAVVDLKLDSPIRVARQMEAYRRAGFPEGAGLHATMFLVRRHLAPDCIRFSDEWWGEVDRDSKRDQLSFDFIRWRLGTRIKTLPLSYLDNPVFRWAGRHRLSTRVISEHSGPGPRRSGQANDSM